MLSYHIVSCNILLPAPSAERHGKTVPRNPKLPEHLLQASSSTVRLWQIICQPVGPSANAPPAAIWESPMNSTPDHALRSKDAHGTSKTNLNASQWLTKQIKLREPSYG